MSKSISKLFQETTEWGRLDTYPQYKRRSLDDIKRFVETQTGPVDNMWIVQYSPYLCLNYNCNMNVKVKRKKSL